MILVVEKRTEEVEPKCIPVTPASVTGGVEEEIKLEEDTCVETMVIDAAATNFPS